MVKTVFSIMICLFIYKPNLASDTLKTPTIENDSIKKARFKVLGLPLFFFTPETKFGGGAAGLSTFNFKKDTGSTRASSIQFGVAFTQLKQILIYLPFQLWLQNEKWNVNGELGYYKYNFYYYGIGTSAKPSNQERYDVLFPRIKLSVLKQIKKNWYFGGRYFYDGFKITGVENGGKLSQQTEPGSKGGRVSTIGLVFKIDSRDYQFNATKGVFLETALQHDNKIWGASFEHIRLTFDYARYKKFNFGHVLAGNIFTSFGNGTVPFYQMAVLGGTKKMRGFYEGRYRDKNMWMLQGEYRATLWKRFGMVAFATLGDVSDRISSFKANTVKIAYGTGLRVMIDKKQKINVRLDIAWADPKPNFYLTLTEAF
jgi:hypothetical protein